MGKQNNQQSSSPRFNLVSAKQKASCPQHRPRSQGTTVLCGGDSGRGWGWGWRGGQGRAQASLFELPLLATHGAVLLHLLRVQPLEDAVHMETV